jgi:iron complex outermembrane recepter protein
VRIITNKPNLNEYTGSMMVGGSWGDGTNALYDAEAVANIPIVQDVFGVRLVGWYSDGGGFIDSLSSGEENINDHTISGVRGTALWRPTDRLSFTFMAVYQDIEVDGSQVFMADAGPYFSTAPTPEPYEEELALYSLVGDYQLDFGTITAATSWFDRHYDAFSDTTPTASGFGLPGVYSIVDASQRAIWSSELRFASDFDGPFQIVTGVAYQHDDNSYENVVAQSELNQLTGCTIQASCVQNNLATRIVSARNVTSDFQSWALFAEGEYAFTDQLTLTVGVRQFSSEQDNRELTLQSLRFPSPDPASVQTTPQLALDETIENEKTSFNFALAYEPSDDLTFYGRAASGFRQGGINNAAFAANFGTEIPAGFGPDEVWNYEVGVKGYAFDNMLTFEAAVFHIDWKDQQVPAVSANGAFTFTTNAGKSVVNGAELEATLRPLAGLTFTTGLTYTDSHLTEDQPPTSGDESAPGQEGDRLPYVSKWGWTGTAEYEWPAFGEWTGYARANASYKSKAYTAFNTDNPFYRETGDYVLADLAAGIRTEKLDIGLMVRNITDKAAQVSVEVIPDGYRVFTVRPRTIGITVRAAF